MYHTEGYLDRQTYFSKGHIWSRAIRHQGNVCYIWCVLEREDSEKENRLPNNSQQNIETKIVSWMKQELVGALEQGQSAIQKELNRFEAYLGVRVHLYYKRHFFSDRNGSWQFVSSDVGVYVSQSVSELAEVRQILQSKEAGSVKEEKKEALEWVTEQLGNQLITAMLQAMSEGRLKQGYFLLWEDKDAF